MRFVGMSAQGLAAHLGLTPTQVLELAMKLRDKLPGLRKMPPEQPAGDTEQHPV